MYSLVCVHTGATRACGSGHGRNLNSESCCGNPHWYEAKVPRYHPLRTVSGTSRITNLAYDWPGTLRTRLWAWSCFFLSIIEILCVPVLFVEKLTNTRSTTQSKMTKTIMRKIIRCTEIQISFRITPSSNVQYSRNGGQFLLYWSVLFFISYITLVPAIHWNALISRGPQYHATNQQYH